MDVEINFCASCGNKIAFRVPPGDSLPRHVCDHCGAIHYQNPRIVVGAVPAWEDRVLLCRRAIEPRLGKWTLPAGFMENGETVAEGAIRETLEEACARIRIDGMFSVVSVPRVNQVHVFYRAQLVGPEFSPGEESLETMLFAEADIPWDEIAFPTVHFTLQRYFDDYRRGTFGFHSLDIPHAGR